MCLITFKIVLRGRRSLHTLLCIPTIAPFITRILVLDANALLMNIKNKPPYLN